MDVARLGYAIDSSQADKASASLDRMTAASKRAEAGSKSLATGAKSAAAAAADMATGTTSVAASASRAVAPMGKINSAFGMNRQLMYQMVDIAQGIPLALQSPVYGLQNIAIQMGQVGQLYYGQGGMRAALKDMGVMLKGAASSVLGLLTPIRLLGLGVVAVGALVVASALSWLRYGKQLDDVAKQAGTTTQSLAALNSAAAFKGISDKDFFSGAENFASSIYDAKANMGGLAELLAVNGKRAGTFEQTMGAVADIIKNAANDQQRLKLLQEAGLPANMQWVNLMRGGASGLEEAKRQAVAFGGAANDNMIAKAKEFGEAWDRGIQNLKTGFRNLFLDVFGWFEEMSSKGTAALIKIVSYLPKSLRPDVAGNILKYSMQGNNGSRLTQSGADEFYGAFGSRFKQQGGAGTAVDPAVIKAQIAAQQAYYNILGQTLTVKQQIAQTDLQIKSYQMQPGAISLTEQQIANLKRLAAERALGLDQIKAGTDAYRVEAESIGMSAERAAAYALVQGQINQHIRDGNPLRADEIALLEQEGDKYAAAMKKANDLQFAKDGVKGFMSDLRTGLQNGEGFWKSFGNAALNVLNKIIDKIESQFVDALFSANKAGPGSGGLFGGLFSGIGKLFGFANGGVMTAAGALPLNRYANGGVANSPQLAMFGEGRKPEAYVPLPDGRRIPVNINAGGRGQNGGTVINFAPKIDARGASVDAVARLETALNATAKTLAQHINGHATIVKSTVSAWRKNTPSALGT